MTFIEIFILSLIEGLTEFIPVSSTGHLILASKFMGLQPSEFQKAFDVIIQFGAILAVVYIYRKDFKLDFGFYKKLFIGFLPAAIVGFLLKDKINELMDSATVVAVALILGGIAMMIVDHYFKHAERTEISDKDSFKVGLFQCLALIPGVSRSGATIVGGQLLGFSRSKAAEFSFFLAVPTMAAATVYKLWKIRDLLHADHATDLALGVALSFIFAILAIKFFISIVKKYGFMWFGVYRIILGVGVLLFMRS